ncbi:MAG: YciI family protein, partial [Pseudomonadota bacterium]
MARMTGYAVACYDKPGPEAAQIRDEKMAEHLAHIETTLDKLWIAGPLFGDAGVIGSLLIYKADTPEEARALAMADPYGQAGIWER